MPALARSTLLATALLVAGCAPAPVSQRPETTTAADVDAITAVLRRDFRARGIATMARVEQDAIQRACNLHQDNPPPELAKSLEEAEMRAIRWPSGGYLGDWKRGRQIAESGRGMQWNDQAGQAAGGSCYNCHQLSKEQESHGTLGPSLLGFAKLRGHGTDIQRYAYGKIWNAKAYNACSQMPRMGQSGTLTEQQVKDLVAYLMDPASPVNR